MSIPDVQFAELDARKIEAVEFVQSTVEAMDGKMIPRVTVEVVV